jgi:Tfp pilus assembly protein PilP
MSKQKKNNRTKEQRLSYYITQQKRDVQKTLGKLEYLKRYEPDVYRKIMDKG